MLHVLTVEKTSKGEGLEDEFGHSYTPSLIRPYKRIAPIRRSFTKKEMGKNSMEVLFE